MLGLFPIPLKLCLTVIHKKNRTPTSSGGSSDVYRVTMQEKIVAIIHTK